AHKQRQVVDCLSRIGHLDGFVLHPIVPSPRVFAYRNKMEFTFETGPQGLYAGLHAAGDASRIEEIGGCHIQDDGANAILRACVSLCRTLGLTTSREGQPSGLLRRLVIRKGSADGRFLVVLATRGQPFPEARRVAAELMESLPTISGVVR